MSLGHSPSIVTSGLQLLLDAANTKSYPGTGTTWFDLSGNARDFTINASAYSTSGGIAHMNFEGSFGSAKRVVGGVLTDVPGNTNGTIMVFSTILNSTGNWRTMVRGASADHQVIIENGQNNLGMYDNNTNAFISSGYNITSLPNPYTQFNCLVFKLSQSSPYYDFSFNGGTSVATITNANATFNNGFCVIGAYHNESTNVNTSTQYWGKIGYFMYYNKHLSQAEVSQNFNALRGRYGI